MVFILESSVPESRHAATSLLLKLMYSKNILEHPLFMSNSAFDTRVPTTTRTKPRVLDGFQVNLVGLWF